MKQLIVTADDFGYTRSVNEGIAFAWEHSPVGEVSALVNAAASEHSFELARKHKISNIGFHLNLDMGKPLTKCSSLAPGGSFRKLLSEKELFDALTVASASDVEKEILAQFDAFVDGFGRKPTHISSHHAVHADKKVLDVCISLCKQYKIPLRLPVAMANTITFLQNYSGEVMVKRAGVKTSNYIFGEVFNNDVKYGWPSNPEISPIIESFRSKLHKLPSGLIELVAHIGFMDSELFNTSSLNWQRVKDLVALMDPSFKKALETVGCSIVDWKGKAKKYKEIDYEKAYYLR